MSLTVKLMCAACVCSLAASECDEHCTWNDCRVFNGTAQVRKSLSSALNLSHASSPHNREQPQLAALVRIVFPSSVCSPDPVAAAKQPVSLNSAVFNAPSAIQQSPSLTYPIFGLPLPLQCPLTLLILVMQDSEFTIEFTQLRDWIVDVKRAFNVELRESGKAAYRCLGLGYIW
jgi:hypothetical protein